MPCTDCIPTNTFRICKRIAGKKPVSQIFAQVLPQIDLLARYSTVRALVSSLFARNQVAEGGRRLRSYKHELL